MRVVRNVASGDLARETATAAAALADKCERLADDIGVWLQTHPEEDEKGRHTYLPPEFSAQFDGRLFSALEGLLNRKYLTREVRDRQIHASYVFEATRRAQYLREWANRLRRR